MTGLHDGDVILGAQLNMPALLGMLVAGAALQNAGAIRLPHQWSAKIRSGGLAVILLRAGLKIDEKAFQRAGFLVARHAPVVTHALWLLLTAAAHRAGRVC